jgi:hypothetical protein
MKIPERLQAVDRQEAVIREDEYDDTAAITADFGPAASDISVDIVGETAIVIAGGDQFEFDLPAGVEEITTNNGILTIEG